MQSLIIKNKGQRIIMLTIGGTIAILLNSLAAFNSIVGILLGVSEILLLIVFFFKGNVVMYILLYIFITTISLEGEVYFTGDSNIPLYNFLNLPKLHGYHIYIFAILPWLLILKHRVGRRGYEKKYTNLRWFLTGITTIGIMGFLMSFLNLLLNVNNIEDSSIYLLYLRRDVLKTGWIISLSLLLGKLLLENKKFAESLEIMIHSMLLSIVPSSLILIVLGKTIIFNKTQVLPIGLYFFYGVLLIVFVLYQNYKESYISLVFGVMAGGITLIFPSVLGGKWWLTVFCIPFFVLFLFWKQSNNRKAVLMILAIGITSVIVYGISWYSENASQLSLNKLYSAKAVLEIWKPDWFENMPNSPKHRIDEFVNIVVEFREHPLFLTFGKGYGGNILHHIELKPWTVDGDFSVAEITEGLFFNLHETINWMFMKSGLFGLLFAFVTLGKCIKNIFKSPWLIFGIIWFVFYFYSFISLSFGLACFMLGLYQADKSKSLLMEYDGDGK